MTYAAELTVLTLVYIGLTWISLPLQEHGTGTAPFWPSAGLGLVLIWLHGRRYALAIVLGQFAIGLWLERALPAVGASTLVALMEAVVGAMLLSWARVTPALASLREVLLFLLLGAVVPALLAGLAIASLLWGLGYIEPSAFDDIAGVLALGDGLGLLVIAPFLLVWRHGWPFQRRGAGATWVLLLGMALLATAAIMLAANTPRGLFFLLLPFVVVMAFSHGMAGVTSIAVLLTVCILGIGVYQGSGRMLSSVRLLFIGTAAMTGYLLAVVLQQRQRAERLLVHQARHDRLTGLPNRGAFDARLRQLTRQSGRHAVVYLDLTSFTLINDSQGHDLGDRFLAGLARALVGGLPAGTFLARLGGDEFGVLCAGEDELAVAALAAAVQRGVRGYVHVEQGLRFRVGASIGTVVFDGSDNPGTVFVRAQRACREALADGHNHIRQVRAHQDSPMHDPMVRLAANLDDALAGGRFVMVRQAIVPLGSGPTRVPHYEMLLRVRDANGDLQPPARFLQVAEQYDLMPRVDCWVVEECFRYRASIAQPLQLSINLSGRTLNDPALYEHWMRLRDRHGVDPADICFEITEQVAIRDLDQALASMHKLVEAGFAFSLDDFGSGVAGFGYLRRLPVAYVKIDGQFVRNLAHDAGNAIIVRSVVELAAHRGMTCIGEWVEDLATVERLRELGVTYGQGFYLHRPEPIA